MREQGAGYRITDLQTSERPRERLVEHGAQALSNAELLAILLRTGLEGANAVEVGRELLQTLNGLIGIQRASFDELKSIKGIGFAKAAQVKAAIELGRRITIASPGERSVINSPEDAANLVLYEMAALSQEELWVIYLDTRNRVLKISKIYRGSLNSSQIRIAELFKEAITTSAAQMIVIHNHPSGDPTPSPEDIAITRAIVSAGKLLDIEVLDHLVIGQGKYTSLKQRGLGF